LRICSTSINLDFMPKHYLKAEIKNLPKSRVEIDCQIETGTLTAIETLVLKEMSVSLELPGFRKGKAPEAMARSRIGEMKILEEAAKRSIREAYVEIVEKEKLRTVGEPSVVIKKLASGNPLDFTLTVSVLNDWQLPDYEKTARATSEVRGVIDVSESEVTGVIEELRRQKAHANLHKNNTPHDHEKPEMKLLEVDDAFAQSFGKFKDLQDLKSQIKKNLTREKERKAREAHRVAILEKILGETDAEVPDIMVENEIDMTLAQFKNEIGKAGTSYEDYLKSIGKSEDGIRKELKGSAEKKVKMQVLLSQIAAKEKILAPSEEIQKETSKILTIHSDADPVKARSYVAMTLTNEKVFEFLEGLTKSK